MTESVMLLSIGFLVAALLGIALAPLVHRRAARLTTLRLDSAIPSSVAELRADKDQLRAEFAMSVRRLEVTVEEMRAKTATYFAELGRNNELIKRLKTECHDKNATIGVLEEQNRALQSQLRGGTKNLETESFQLMTAQRELSRNKAAFEELLTVEAERTKILYEQKRKIELLKTEVDASGAMVHALREKLSESQNSHRSVAALHREIDRLEAQMDIIIAERSQHH